ncbi:DUF4382 domain-containing protein [bacterium]|nr:DUF4382 domain-containing protein [bacterium]
MMFTKRFGLFLLAAILLLAFTFAGCSDDDDDSGVNPSEGQGELMLYLVDDPAMYDEVNIVVTEVSVHMSDGDQDNWIIINDTTRTFDLLNLTNGVYDMLGVAQLDAGHYTQIRLKIGTGSNVVVDGTEYPLDVPSGSQSGLKLNHAFTIEPNTLYELTLDFDAGSSIIVTGNEQYKLKPVIRVAANETSGTISGTVLPPAAQPMAWTTLGDDTVSTYASDLTGEFKLMALPEGSYDVTVTSLAKTYQDTTISDVLVVAGQDTDLGTIELPAL